VASGIEKDSAARDIESVSRAGIEYAPAPDELPFELQLQVISTILAAVAVNHIDLLCRFPPRVFGVYECSLIVAATEYIMRRAPAK